jgi:hypothetical protein
MSNRKIINAAATGGIGYYPVASVNISDPYYDKVSLLLNGDVEVDTNFANVSLLLTGNDLLDKSNNKLTVTAYGQASVTSVKKQFGTGSYYFDGSGDYIRPAASDTCMFGTGDFTIEFWTYRISGGELFGNGPASGGSFGLGLGAANGDTTKLQCAIYGSPTANLSCVTNFPSNQWIHVAVTRASGTTRIFLNGVKDAETTAGGANNTTNTPSVGEVWLGSGSTLNGYIDDFRITKGVARYTTNFTPPTQALPSHEILDSSVYRLPVTTYGNARIDTATKKFGTGAMYFDGTGDYSTVPMRNDLQLGSGQFTVECWFYAPSSTGDTALLGNYRVNSYPTNTAGWDIILQSGGVNFRWGSPAYNDTGTPTPITLNQWNHIAVVNTGSAIKMFINGTQVFTTSTNITVTNSAESVMWVGWAGSLSGTTINPFTGYIDDLRITKGVARYTANFTPPTAALPTIPPTIAADPWWGNVSLLLDGNTTDAYDPYWQNVSLMLTGDDFIDWSNNHLAITNTNITLSNTIKKYGTSSLAFSGVSGNALSISDQGTTNSIGTGDFTVEAWAYYLDLLGWRDIICFVGPPSWGITTNTGDLGAYGIGINASGTIVPINQWFHVAVTRQSGTVRLFLNGVLVASATNTTSFTTTQINIGSWTSTTSENLNGYIAELRMTKGIARYTANFTPPIAALPAFKIQDRTQNNLTITPYGNVQLSTDVKKNGTGSINRVSGGYAVIPSNSLFSFGSGDFTVEFWYRQDHIADTGIVGKWNSAAGASPEWSEWLFTRHNPTAAIDFWVNDTVSLFGPLLISTTLDFTSWKHVAAVRNGSTWTLFINGVAESTATTTRTMQTGTSPLRIGAWAAGGLSGNFHIDDIRITKGYARYTQNFTPPSQSFATQYISTGFDANYADVSLLLTGEGTNGSTTFNDLSNTPKTITTYGDTKISTAVKKYGTGAMYFDGSGDVLKTPPVSAFTFGTGDFTVEGWFYQTADNVYPSALEINNHLGVGGILFITKTSGNACIYAADTGGAAFGAPQATTLNTWNHIAWVRNNGVLRTYVNGISSSSVALTLNITATTSVTIGGEQAINGGYTYPGYIDDFRVTKGIARYTQNFTPPTYALATTTGTPFDVNRADTSLLLRGNGTNGSTSFTDESPNNLTVTNNGSVTVNTTTKKYGTGSMYFDGTNYLSLASNAALNLSGVSWTVELWCYPTTASLANRILFTKRVPNSGTCSYQGYLNVSNSGISFFNGAAEYQSSTTLDLNAWNHIAYVCDRTNVKVYKNGVLILTASATEAANNTETLLIGNGLYTGYSLQFPGYIDDFRITKGYARYTANFTPPTYEDPIITGTQYDYNYAQVSLLLNGDGTNGSQVFTDLSSSPKAITNIGSVTVNTTTKKFGTGSIAFSGSNYLTVPCNPIFDFGTGDFTLESWVYVAPSATLQGLFDTRSGQTYTNYIWHFETGPKLCFWLSGTYCTTTNNIPTNQWVHIATVRASGTIKHYVNGVVDNNTGFSQPGTINSTNTTALIGRLWDTSAYYLNGYIDDFRITKGLARYTQNFTPPTAPLPTSGGY